MNVKEWQARCEKKTVWMTFATFGGALGLWYRLKPTPVPFLMNMPANSLASVAVLAVGSVLEAAAMRRCLESSSGAVELESLSTPLSRVRSSSMQASPSELDGLARSQEFDQGRGQINQVLVEGEEQQERRSATMSYDVLRYYHRERELKKYQLTHGMLDFQRRQRSAEEQSQNGGQAMPPQRRDPRLMDQYSDKKELTPEERNPPRVRRKRVNQYGDEIHDE